MTGNTPSGPTPQELAEMLVATGIEALPVILQGLKGLFGGQNIDILVQGLRHSGQAQTQLVPCSLKDAMSLGISISVGKDDTQEEQELNPPNPLEPPQMEG